MTISARTFSRVALHYIQEVDATGDSGTGKYHLLIGLRQGPGHPCIGVRPFKMTAAKVRPALASMGRPETKVGDLCTELGITRQTLCRHVSPTGELGPDGEILLSR